MKKNTAIVFLLFMTTVISCHSSKENMDNNHSKNDAKGTFGYDLSFLEKEDSGLVVLEDATGSEQVIVSPKYQAKVFTSTAQGLNGYSFGWVHYQSFAGPLDPHMNGYGGENRFWLGPEGGIYSLFFKPGTKMLFADWHTPAPFDSQPWSVSDKNDSSSVTMHKDMLIENRMGTQLSIGVNRRITVLDRLAIENQLQIPNNDSVSMVGYETDQTITNTGHFAWTEKTGMPCIWILDMFPPSPHTVITIPFHPLKAKNERIATTDYFGAIPPDRLIFKDSMLYFKADGRSRGKISLPPYRAEGVEGSYDAQHHVLTILTADIDPSGRYLYQKWDTLGNPFNGDVLNAYNDGPLKDGSQLGPFYELESVSPAAFLEPGASLSHRQSVYHFVGNEKALDRITRKVLGITIDDIKQAFKG